MADTQIARRQETALDRFRGMSLDNPNDIIAIFVESRFFKDAQSLSQAAVKVVAGREIGLGPFASIANIDLVKGNVRMRSVLLAARVKAHEKYDYRVTTVNKDECSIDFFEREDGGDWKPIGTSVFTMGDAKIAGLAGKDTYTKHGKNMLFARAMSDGVNMFCPDVVKGVRVYCEADDFGPVRPEAAPPSAIDQLDADLGLEEKIIDAEEIPPEPDYTALKPAPRGPIEEVEDKSQGIAGVVREQREENIADRAKAALDAD